LKRKLWIREEFLNHERPFQFFVVHGHTPVRAPEVRFNRVNIDTGAFATGRLTCVAIEGSTIAPL
jgi:serine/threonine protein phosphatase 1